MRTWGLTSVGLTRPKRLDPMYPFFINNIETMSLQNIQIHEALAIMVIAGLIAALICAMKWAYTKTASDLSQVLIFVAGMVVLYYFVGGYHA